MSWTSLQPSHRLSLSANNAPAEAPEITYPRIGEEVEFKCRVKGSFQRSWEIIQCSGWYNGVVLRKHSYHLMTQFQCEAPTHWRPLRANPATGAAQPALKLPEIASARKHAEKSEDNADEKKHSRFQTTHKVNELGKQQLPSPRNRAYPPTSPSNRRGSSTSALVLRNMAAAAANRYRQ